MGLLNGGGAALMAAVFGGVYLDATLHRRSITDDGKGGGTTTFADEAVKAQLDNATEAMRGQAGYADTDQRILVLAHGVDRPNTDCEISVDGRRWKIASVATDPATTVWDLRGVVV